MAHNPRAGIWPPLLALAALLFLSPLGAEVRYGTGSWDREAFGNHRAVVRVSEPADAVRARLPWRRRDTNPGKENIVIVDAASGTTVGNIFRATVNREYGDLVFQPPTAPGEYFIYYRPYRTKGRSNYPTVVYPEPVDTAESSWLERHALDPRNPAGARLDRFPEARLVEFQSVDEFNSVFPMEVIASQDEVATLLEKHPASTVLLFPEDRRYPIRMAEDLPVRWIETGPRHIFTGEASRGEYYAFQVGVFACREDIQTLRVSFSDLRAQPGLAVLPASALRCTNLGGVNWDGQTFEKACPVKKGTVQALWCGALVPADAEPGLYSGTVSIIPDGKPASTIRLTLTVKPELLPDSGDGEPWRHSRLRWLDSTVAADDGVVSPFTAMAVRGKTVECLGRRLKIGPMGLPQSLESFFAPQMTHLLGRGREVLASPMRLVVETAYGRSVAWTDAKQTLGAILPGAVEWTAESRAADWDSLCEARMEFDGFVQFKVKVTARKPCRLKDIRLEVPLRPDAARYMMGLGFKGGTRPAHYAWTWDARNNQDALWIGDVNAGLQLSLRGENYVRPLNTNFYLSQPLRMPPAWFNHGRGGVVVEEQPDGTVLVKAYCGERTVQAGETLHLYFNLLLTPFKPLDVQGHFSTRYFHAFKPVSEVAATGANTINVHHANAVNPYINYPFLRPDAMKAYIEEAHARGMKVKIYYTIRELSNRAAELFALRSLGNEIFTPGPGGGFSWLQEHLAGNYIAGWFVPELEDAALINSGMSRWHNYYLEGLNWLVRNVGIDGLYIDDVAFDRTTMKRARKILDRSRPGALIDLHSANQYNPRDGFASSANLYLEHFPYLNRLWFGEYFDYNGSPPEYWLVEISGIPFGLMGEMLQDGGNPWRGAVFGMTSRLPWSGNPSGLWKAWDDFGIQDSRMVGYWVESSPVKTSKALIPATAYIKKERVLVALASWAKEPERIILSIDWKALGLDPLRSRLRAPAIPEFQEGAVFAPDEAIPVQPGKGWLLIIEER